jgi:hypothetical protein
LKVENFSFGKNLKTFFFRIQALKFCNWWGLPLFPILGGNALTS